MDDLALDGMDEIVAEFIVESTENLDELDQQLVELEQDPTSRPLLAAIFRTIHTIKGTSGFLAFNDLERTTHVGETLLSRLRDGHMVASAQTVTVLLQMIDAVRDLLGRIAETGSDAGADLTAVVAAITAELEGSSETAPAPIDPPDAPFGVTSVAADPAEDEAAGPSPLVMEPPAAPLAAAATSSSGAGPAPSTDQANSFRPQLAESGAEETTARRNTAESSVRVDVDLLENLMAMVGELVLTRNQILASATRAGDPELLRVSHRLDVVSSELQQGVMKTRMRPIEHIWSKLPRVVRDLGTQLGRQVRLEMEGAETELDRTLLEAVKDPLTHLVRNSVDHGLEPVETRRAVGKNPVGCVTLRARHEGGQVLVEVSDDGKGMDPAVIGARAVERGLTTEEQLVGMSTSDVLSFVFAPGFSTAATVTSVSGRGVGMDVVKTNIERIGGSIEIESEVGRGSTTRLRVPLTLAIVPAIMVAAGGQRFAVPQNGLRELVGLGEGREGVTEDVGGAEVFRLRGQLLPLVRLREALGLPQAPDPGGTSVIAVLDNGGRRFGLVVDAVLATHEIVVKPLGAQLGHLSAYSGATILGDGGLALILDLQALSRAPREVDVPDRHHAEVSSAASDESGQLLIVGVASRRVALPLDIVTRLEVVPAEAVERVGRRWVVKHRGRILPVINLAEHLGERRTDRSTAPLVVYATGDRAVAFMADEILDVMSAAAAAASDLSDRGLSGSALLEDHIVEMLDVRQAVLAADPNFYETLAGGHMPVRQRRPDEDRQEAQA